MSMKKHLDKIHQNHKTISISKLGKDKAMKHEKFIEKKI
jgi:hypothetical protein